MSLYEPRQEFTILTNAILSKDDEQALRLHERHTTAIVMLPCFSGLVSA